MMNSLTHSLETRAVSIIVHVCVYVCLCGLRGTYGMGEGAFVSLALQCRGCGRIMSWAATSCALTQGRRDRKPETPRSMLGRQFHHPICTQSTILSPLCVPLVFFLLVPSVFSLAHCNLMFCLSIGMFKFHLMFTHNLLLIKYIICCSTFKSIFLLLWTIFISLL